MNDFFINQSGFAHFWAKLKTLLNDKASTTEVKTLQNKTYELTALALKAAFPNNRIIVDNIGMPSVMVYIPKFKISDVIAGGSNSVHPAFIVNGVEKAGIYISKYQNKVVNERAYSLPAEDPAAIINFDTASSICSAKGSGWHLMTNTEWAALSL